MKFRTTGPVGGKYHTVEAVQWDGTVTGAEPVFDFVSDAAGCQITDEGDFLIYPTDLYDEPERLEPGWWVLRLGLGHYVICTGETMQRKFAPEAAS